MSSRDPMSSQDPQPHQTPGLEPGGGVPPGETPPAGDQMSGAAQAPVEREKISAGTNKLALTLVLVGALLFAAMMIAMIVVRAQSM
ncbi:MAG: DUF6480 family protein [Actinomycetota bacterium]|nr:DUF6480 family protein [Actinomycetota bacterium]